MDYRILLFENDKYTEHLIHSNEDSVDVFSYNIDAEGRTQLFLPTRYEAVSTLGREIIKIGNDNSCMLRLMSKTPDVIIIGKNLKSDDYIFINGIKKLNAELVSGDKILIGTTEIIYHEGWLEICGICGNTFETDFVSYIKNRIGLMNILYINVHRESSRPSHMQRFKLRLPKNAKNREKESL